MEFKGEKKKAKGEEKPKDAEAGLNQPTPSKGLRDARTSKALELSTKLGTAAEASSPL